MAIRQMTTMLVLDKTKQLLAENLGKDILKLEWKFQSDTQNWVLENDNKIIYRLLNERDARHEHILQVARQMMTAARTAPKGKGN